MKYEIYYEYPGANGDTCFQKRFDTFKEAVNAYNRDYAGFIQNSEGKVLRRFRDNWGGAREGSGRPSRFEGEKKPINLKLTVEAIDILTEEANRSNVSRSDIVNKLIFDNLK